jgi:3-hydroxypropionate dehydrogenase (NADP+)
MTKVIKSIACVGAGTIGHSWALLFAKEGFIVNLYDVSEEILKKALQRIQLALETLHEEGLLKTEDIRGILSRIKPYTSLEEAVRDVEYIQESAPENLILKRDLFSMMGKYNREAILASSTSSIPMSRIVKDLSSDIQKRALVVHPFNPPHIIPLVEIVPSPMTDPDIVKIVYDLMVKLGKAPIIVKKEVPGFVANRLQFALFREAINLVLNDVASIEDVEKALYQGLGLRWAMMGPFITFYLADPGGLEQAIIKLKEAFESVWRDIATWTQIPPPHILKALNDNTKVLVKTLIEKRGLKDLAELPKWRDKTLLRLIKAREG